MLATVFPASGSGASQRKTPFLSLLNGLVKKEFKPYEPQFSFSAPKKGFVKQQKYIQNKTGVEILDLPRNFGGSEGVLAHTHVMVHVNCVAACNFYTVNAWGVRTNVHWDCQECGEHRTHASKRNNNKHEFEMWPVDKFNRQKLKAHNRGLKQEIDSLVFSFMSSHGLEGQINSDFLPVRVQAANQAARKALKTRIPNKLSVLQLCRSKLIPFDCFYDIFNNENKTKTLAPFWAMAKEEMDEWDRCEYDFVESETNSYEFPICVAYVHNGTPYRNTHRVPKGTCALLDKRVADSPETVDTSAQEEAPRMIELACYVPLPDPDGDAVRAIIEEHRRKRKRKSEKRYSGALKRRLRWAVEKTENEFAALDLTMVMDDLHVESAVYDSANVPGEPIEVGAPGDCWSHIPGLTKYVSGIHVSVDSFIDGVEKLLQDEIFSELVGELYLEWEMTDDGDYHIEDSSSFGCTGDHILEVLAKMRAGPFTKPHSVEDSGIELPVDVLVGSVGEVTQAAEKIYGPELFKAVALKHLTQEYDAMPTTNFYLNARQKLLVEKYIDMPVNCKSTKPQSSDHPELIVARDLIRQVALRLFHPDEDVLTTLHVGATFEDFKGWNSRPNHSFYFHQGESKDHQRTYPKLAAWAVSKLKDLKLPAMRSLHGETAKRLSLNEKTLLSLVNDHILRRPAISTDKIRKATRLMFSDSIYGMSEVDFVNYFEKSGACEAFATIFVPTYLYGDQDLNSSDIYDLHLDYDVRTFYESLDLWWPDVIAGVVLTEIIPGSKERWEDFHEKTLLDNIVGYMHEWIKTNAKRTATWFRDWLTGVLQTPFPLEAACGIPLTIMKYTVILEKWVNRIKKAISDRFRYLTVTWRDGFQNGYRHNEWDWKKWAVQRTYTNGRITVASEVITRIGEMNLIKFWVNSKDDVIVHKPGPPAHLQTMRIWDWQKTLDNSPFWRAGDLNPVWTTCLVTDFYEVLSWCIAEPKASLDFDVVATACNRVRRGLSLVSNISHEGLKVRDPDLANFALNVYLACNRDADKIRAITDNESLFIKPSNNLAHLLKKTGKIMLVLATGGLAIPAFAILEWCFTIYRQHNFVEEPVERPPKKEYVRAKPQSVDQETKYEAVLPAVGATEVNRCHVCRLLSHKIISDQSFAIDKCTHEAQPVNLSMTPMDVSEARILMDTAIDFHRPHVSPKSIEGPRKMESFLSAVQTTGTNFECEFHYILGGPGTGKSYIARALMREEERAGRTAVMYLPLKGLKADYDKVVMPDKESYQFQADTWFKVANYGKVDTLFVDEFTLVDSVHFRAYVNYCMPSQIYLIGDEKQQHKSPDVSIHPGIAESHWWADVVSKCSKHELQRNFRFVGQGAAFRVKWLNWKYGYRMYTTETDMTTFDVMEAQEFRRHPNLVEERFVFSHATARDAYGIDSGPGEENENHSVYSAQGRTVNTSAVAIFDGDAPSFERHGSIIVAMTRSKQMPIIVIHDEGAQVVNDFALLAGLDSDSLDLIQESGWPAVQSKAEKVNPMTPAEIALNKTVSEFPISDIDPVSSPKKIKVDFGNDPVWNEKLTFEMNKWVLDIYDACTYEALPDVLKPIFLEKIMIPLANAHQDAVQGADGKWYMVSGSAKQRTKDSPDKLRVSLSIFFGFLDQHCAYVKYQPRSMNGNKDPPSIKIIQGVGDPFACVIELTSGHVERISKNKLPKMTVKNVGLGTETDMDMWAQRNSGSYYGEFFKFGKKSYSGLDLEDDYELGGIGPTIKRVDNPNIPSEFTSFVPCPPSQWIVDTKREERFESKPRHKTKIRFGKDCYRLANHIDNSDALVVKTGVYYPSVVGAIGKPSKDFKPGFKLNWANSFFERTKGGRITRKEKAARAVVAGGGNHFTGNPNETMRALQRVCGERPTKGLSKEGYEFFEKAMTEAYHAMHKQKRLDVMEINSVVHRFWVDANQRNYAGRTKAERDKHSNVLLKRVTNKSQYKPHKDGRIDHLKTGQTITSTSPFWNIVHGGAMRVVNYIFKKTLQDDVFYDAYERADQFRIRMTKAIQSMPVGAAFGIVDGEEFDSGQTHGTLVAEMIHRNLMGVSQRFIDSYYRIREPGRWVYYGFASGKTSYEKGSGFSDTLLGNTTLEQMVGHHAIVGVGPRVVGLKGDDFLKVQFGLSPNYDFIQKLQRYSNLKLKVNISYDGGEFLGCTVSKEGMFLSIPRIALKAIGAPSRDLKHFQEQQKALREKIQEIRDDGLEETMYANSVATGISKPTVETCLAIAESVSHLNETQYNDLPARRFHKPPMPGYYKAVDMHTFNSF